jgi:hypothetical protein
VLKDAELLALLGHHGDTKRDTLVGDLEIVVHKG